MTTSLLVSGLFVEIIILHMKNLLHLLASLEGNGQFNGYPISKGQHFIVPAQVEALQIEGHLDLIIASL